MTSGFKLLDVLGGRSRVFVFMAAMATVGVLLLTFSGGCSRERPLRPSPLKYNVYVQGDSPTALAVLDADSLTVIDSIALGDTARIGSLVGSPDGKWLYAEEIGGIIAGPMTLKLDLASGMVVGRLQDPNPSDLVTTPDGLTLIREWCALEYVDLPTWSIRGVDSTRMCNVSAVEQSRALIGSSPAMDSLLIYDLATHARLKILAIRTMEGEQVSPFRSALLSDFSRALVLGVTHSSLRSYFLVVRVSDAATLLQYPLGSAFGKIAITPDETRALVSAHGESRIGELWGTVDIFDLEGLTHLKRFTQSDFSPDGFPADYIVPIPGTTEAVVCTDWPGAGGPLWKLDWQAIALVSRTKLGGRWSGPVAVGPRLK